jgi:hypothetical protein
MANKYVVEEAELKCSAGSTPAKLKVTSQKSNKIEQKLQATENDKTLMGNFGACALCNGNACAPALQQWKVISSKKTIKGQKLLLDDSFIECAKGGVVNITDPNQSVARLGGADEELDKYYPKLQGDVVFVNGYHSNPTENAEQTFWNAILDLSHERRNFFSLQGESTNEHNHSDSEDIFTNEELRDFLPIDASDDFVRKQLEKSFYYVNGKFKNKRTPFSFNSKLEKFWNYWNNEDNGYDASKLYCDYFNATSRDHYINGSHGLGSNAAHRIDHGIALGYKWAKENWRIYPKEAIPEERLADENDYIHTFTPPYKPVTVVGHSHGAAMSTGVALGILYYAHEIKWKEIALNVIYLASNQPQGLHDEEYYNLIDDKVDFYQAYVTQLNFQKEERGGLLVNKISEVFSRKYNKLLHNRGINEHLEAILGEGYLKDYKNRCVQFTFTNDRGDMVIRDGDIPGIKSACDPETNTDAFHCHFVGKDLKAKSDNDNPKMCCRIEFPDGNYVKYADYFVNRRFNMKEVNQKYNYEKNIKEFELEEWGDYKTVLTRCMEAFNAFTTRKKWYESQYGKFVFRRFIVLMFRRAPLSIYHFFSKKTAAYDDVHNHYAKYLNAYAAFFQAQLYAHFAPVSWINNEEILSDFPNDDYGKISIFDRICKAGEDIFYRVEVKNNPNNTSKTEEQKRQDFKKQFDDMQTRLISTEVGNTEYIKNVIQAYVYNDKEALKKLYKEPNHKKIKPYVDGIYGD